MPHTAPFLRRRASARSDRTLHDQALAKRLMLAIERDLADSDVSGLHLYVCDGYVTMHGMARHALDEALLLAFVEGVEGVVGAEAHLRYAPPDPPA